MVLGVEVPCAAQDIGFCAPLETSPALQAAVASLRAVSPVLKEDHYIAPDIEPAVLIRSGALTTAADRAVLSL